VLDVGGGVALADPFSRLILLLVPVSLAAVWLLWNVESGREPAAFLVGVGSVLLVTPVLRRAAVSGPGGVVS